jgi:hypothetical protein
MSVRCSPAAARARKKKQLPQGIKGSRTTPDRASNERGHRTHSASQAARRSRAGLDLDLVATKHWLAPIGLLRVPLLFKPAVERCNSKLLVIFSVVTVLRLVSLAGRTLRCLLLRGSPALPALQRVRRNGGPGTEAQERRPRNGGLFVFLERKFP